MYHRDIEDAAQKLGISIEEARAGFQIVPGPFRIDREDYVKVRRRREAARRRRRAKARAAALAVV